MYVQGISITPGYEFGKRLSIAHVICRFLRTFKMGRENTYTSRYNVTYSCCAVDDVVEVVFPVLVLLTGLTAWGQQHRPSFFFK